MESTLVIKEYFANYFLYTSDVTFDMEHNHMQVHQRFTELWKVTLVDIGDKTMTGGSLKRVSDYVKNGEAFCLTYGDGVSDINITDLLAFHKTQNVKATLTGIIPPVRFGVLDIQGNKVSRFMESLRMIVQLSMVVSSCCRQKSSTTSLMTRPSGSEIPWKV